MRDVAQQREQLGGLVGVEVAGRLIGQQERGAADQRAGERGALALGVGELVRAGVGLVGKPDAVEQGVDGARARTGGARSAAGA